MKKSILTITLLGLGIGAMAQIVESRPDTTMHYFHSEKSDTTACYFKEITILENNVFDDWRSGFILVDLNLFYTFKTDSSLPYQFFYDNKKKVTNKVIQFIYK
jgi:hypothetical protein